MVEIKKLIIPVFLILIMVTGFVGFDVLNTGQKFDFVGRKFVQAENGYYLTYYGDQPILFQNDPRLVDEYKISDFNINFLKDSGKIYLSVDPNKVSLVSSAVGLFEQNFRLITGKSLVLSCISDSELCKDLPIKTCEDSDIITKVLILDVDNTETVNYKNGCLVIKSAQLDKYTEKIILDLVKNG